MKREPKVLIIDDNANMRETLADILEEKGYEVVTARTAQEGTQAARESFFNIALIDINLPDKTGIELLKEFRSAYPSRINIMVTASGTLKHAVDALNLGADAYVLKPIDFIKLYQIMKECLGKQRKVLNTTEEQLAHLMENTPEQKMPTEKSKI